MNKSEYVEHVEELVSDLKWVNTQVTALLEHHKHLYSGDRVPSQPSRTSLVDLAAQIDDSREYLTSALEFFSEACIKRERQHQHEDSGP